jgi:hypothetical protein
MLAEVTATRRTWLLFYRTVAAGGHNAPRPNTPPPLVPAYTELPSEAMARVCTVFISNPVLWSVHVAPASVLTNTPLAFVPA